MGPCFCDLKKDICDYHCCCDTDCPSNLVQKWRDNKDNICLDESKIKKKKKF